jgi:hypothetical protein
MTGRNDGKAAWPAGRGAAELTNDAGEGVAASIGRRSFQVASSFCEPTYADGNREACVMLIRLQ